MDRKVRCIVFLAGVMALVASGAHADESGVGQAIGGSFQASGRASAAAGNAGAASGQAIFAVIAVPLAITGAVLGSAASVSTGAANDSMRAAAPAPIGTPLTVSSEVITIMPPNEALKRGHDQAR